MKILKRTIFSLIIGVPSAWYGYEKYTLTQKLVPKPFEPVPVDLEKYQGRWFEVYASENAMKKFEKDCACVFVEYGILEPNKKISVNNNCWKNNDTPKATHIEGTADVLGPGSLKVNFFWW